MNKRFGAITPNNLNNKKRCRRIARFIMRLPYLIKSGPFPPIEVLNEIFIDGEYANGMNGCIYWHPFNINSKNYRCIFRHIKQLNKGIYKSNPPSFKLSHHEWREWRNSLTLGDRSLEYLELSYRLLELNKQLEIETEEIEIKKFEFIQLEMYEIGKKINAILMEKHLKK